MEGAPIRIVVIEDHALVREGIVSLLSLHADFEIVGQANDGDEGIALHERTNPDVTLVDLRLPRRSGVEVITTCLRRNPRAVFLVLTTYGSDEDVTCALRAGAKGYMLKGMSRNELEEGIRAVHGGQTYLPPEIAATAIAHTREDELTTREREVLALIAEGKSNREIGQALGIVERTVKGHVNSLLVKLDANDRTGALVAGLRRGVVNID